MNLSESTIGRILASLKRRNLLMEPLNGIGTRRRKTLRPYAIRVPEDKRQPTEPGALVQLDTVHMRTAATAVHGDRRGQPLRCSGGTQSGNRRDGCRVLDGTG